MDTSDSEYFESADEDIPSDEEDCVKDQESESKSSKTEIVCKNKLGNDNILVDQLKNTSIQSSEDILNKNDEVENTDDVESKPEKCDVETVTNKPVQVKNESNVKPKLGTKTETIKHEKSEETKVQKEESCSNKPEAPKPEHTPVSETTESKDDGSLWGDDELDWEVEEKLNEKVTAPIEYEENVTQPIKNVPQKSERVEHKSLPQDSWGGWGTWGASVLSSATQSVTSITTQLTNVIETGLGAIDPEELARIDREEKAKENVKNEIVDPIHDANETRFGLGNLVKLVENTSSKVISGGLDTLETIGKKTMEVLQEGDPGLKKKRALLKIDQNKPVLSQILREAKEKAEFESKNITKKRVKNYETLFDDHHGLVHLEALELLSKQCEFKLKNVQNAEQNIEFMETMDQIKELCDIPDEDDEDQHFSVAEIKERLENAVHEMNVQITFEKLILNWEETEVWLETINLEICDEDELFQQAIETLAQVTSIAMEQFHKIGELLLIKERRSTADEADSLVQITTTLVSLISIVAEKFCGKLNEKKSQHSTQDISGLITNVFFEAGNSSTYIKDALQLLIPVLQVGAI